MTVPVEVDVNPSKKTFEIFVGSPPTSALIKKQQMPRKVRQMQKQTAWGI